MTPVPDGAMLGAKATRTVIVLLANIFPYFANVYRAAYPYEGPLHLHSRDWYKEGALLITAPVIANNKCVSQFHHQTTAADASALCTKTRLGRFQV